MNTEEKAKAYDEALKDMQAIYPKLNGDMKLAVEHAFPQLAESEDERIRKALIEVFKEKLERGFEWVEYGIPNRSVLSWLEKQKECVADNSKTSTEEDERIRLALIKLMTVAGDRYVMSATGFEKERLLAYLEKQKEPLHISETCKENADSFTDEDERIKKIITDSVFYQYGADKEYEDVLDYLDKLEKQKEQKPVQSDVEKEYVRTLKSLISDFLRGKEEVDREYYQQIFDWLDGRHIEQKPVDFPTTDEEVNEFLETHSKVEVPEKYKTPDFVFSKQEYESYPIISKDTTSVKPAEWSEEDEDMLNSCISSIEEAKENRYAYKETDGDTSYDHEIAWLKSLRPVSKESLQSWKPTEEQMYGVERALGILRGYGHFVVADNLQSIYKQLKKL